MGLCARQDGGKSHEGTLGLGKTLIAAECIWSYCEEDLAPMFKILSHDLQKGAGVHGEPVGLTNGHRQSRISDGTDKYSGRTCVQPDFSGYEGFLLRQPSSFDTTEPPSEK